MEPNPSKDAIISVIEDVCIQMTPPGQQIELPRLGEYTNFNWYLIYGKRIGQRPARFIDYENLEKLVDGIEQRAESAVVFYFSENDYLKFSEVMKARVKRRKNTSLRGGITLGWGESEISGKPYKVHTFNINPSHVPFETE